MALSGTISKSIYKGFYTYQMAWTAVQNVAGNYSDVTVITSLIWTNTLSVSSRSGAYTSVNGDKKTYTVGAVESNSGNRDVNTSIFRVYHDDNGNASVAAVASYPIKATLGGTYYAEIKASGTIALDSIPRYSEIQCPSPVYMGTTQQIVIIQKSAEYSSKIYAKSSIGEYEEIGELTPSSTTNVFGWTLPDITSTLLTSDRATYTIKCVTYTNSDLTGDTFESTLDIIAIVPIAIQPNGSFTLSDLTTVPTGWGFVVGYSQPRATVAFDNSADAGAYLKKVTCQFGALETQSFEASTTTVTSCTFDCTQKITAASTPVTVTIEDSRGRIVELSQTINARSYSRPDFNIELTRSDSAGNANVAGTYARVRAKWNISSEIVNGSETNFGSLVIQISGTTKLTYSISNLTQGSLIAVGVIDGIAVSSDTTVTATLTDALTSSSKTATIPKSDVPFSTYKDNGVSFGKPALNTGFYNYLDMFIQTGKTINLIDSNGDALGTSMIVDDLFVSSIWAHPAADQTLTPLAWGYPTLVAINQIGNGFEIASNGDIKCNRTGFVKVNAIAVCSKSTSGNTNVVARLALNRENISEVNSLYYGQYYCTLPLTAIISVSAGDTITFGVDPNTSGQTGWTLRNLSSIVCEYL